MHVRTHCACAGWSKPRRMSIPMQHGVNKKTEKFKLKNRTYRFFHPDRDPGRLRPVAARVDLCEEFGLLGPFLDEGLRDNPEAELGRDDGFDDREDEIREIRLGVPGRPDFFSFIGDACFGSGVPCPCIRSMICLPRAGSRPRKCFDFFGKCLT